MSSIKGGVCRRVLLAAVAMTVVMPTYAQAQTEGDTVIMRRPIILKKSSGSPTTPPVVDPTPPVIVVPPVTDDPEEVDPIVDPGSACDEDADRRIIDARWVSDTKTTGENADGSCTDTKTSYHCTVVTACRVGGNDTPVTSDAADAVCREFLENRGPIIEPMT